MILAERGRREEAIEAFRKTLELRPSDAKAYTNLGSELYRSGRYREAVPPYLTAALLAPSQHTRDNLELVFRKLAREPKEAERYCDALRNPWIAEDLDPEWMAEVHTNIGLNLLSKAESGEARAILDAAQTQFQKALEYRPGFRPALAGSARTGFGLEPAHGAR